MSHFGWNNFWKLHFKQLAGLLPHGREREILKYLHRRSSLNELAKCIAQLLPACKVKVESVWVDGTPQTEFTDNSGASSNCELADLLLLVRTELPNGGLVEERGLLLQAKTTAKHNKLTSGSSTKLERQLLERVNRALPFKLYRDTQLNSHLGTFTLGPTATGVNAGMKDCARFLLAPKFARWLSVFFDHAPYQVGWPCHSTSPFLRKPKGVVQAIIDVGVIKSLGRKVDVPGADAWSNIIAAIRGAYVGKTMLGYGHDRIHTGSAFLCTSHAFMGNCVFHEPPPSVKPPFDLDHWRINPPAISILAVTLQIE